MNDLFSVRRAFDDILNRYATARARADEIRTEIRKGVPLEQLRYAEAIASSGPFPPSWRTIQGRGRRREDIQEQLRRTGNGGGHQKGPAELRRAIVKSISDWSALFSRHPEQARETVLRPLLAGRRMVLTPQITAEGRFYAFEQKLSCGAAHHRPDRGR